MGAGPHPDYDFYPEPPPGAEPGPRPRRPRSLTTLSPDADPAVPGGRLSAPPPRIPPVFERPAPPPGDRRAAVAPPVPAARPAPARQVPAFTAHASAVHAPTDAVAAGPSPAVRLPVPARPARDVALGRRAGRRPGRLTLVVTGLVTLLLVGTGAAVALTPRYLAHQDRTAWASTSVELPPEAAGLPRVPNAVPAAQAKAARAQLLSTGAGPLITELGVYGGQDGPRAVVVAGRPQGPLSAQDRDLVRAGFTTAVARSAVVVTERDPGPLGGWFGCGIHEGRTTMCLAIDAGVVLSITVTTTGPGAVQTARDLRAAVETRVP